MTPSPDNELVNDLRFRIGTGQGVVVVGTGVSAAATRGNPVATWRGLLQTGVSRCEMLSSDLPTGWAGRVGALANSTEIGDLLEAGEAITERLGGQKSGEFYEWLRGTVGRLEVGDPTLLESIRALKAPIVTTNYDTLLTQYTNRQPITWRQRPQVEELLRNERPGILHAHGFWDDPESVILGTSAYSAIARDQHAQTALRTLRMTHTLVFVGFGDGLRDPNLGALLQWSRDVFGGSPYRHYQLAPTNEAGSIQKTHHRDERIFVIPYGRTHEDLPSFLSWLQPREEDERP